MTDWKYKLRLRDVAVVPSLLVSSAVWGDTSHCTFELYSDAMGRAMRVCQPAASKEDCAQWESREPSKEIKRGHAVGKERGYVRLEPGGCKLERVVATCVLKTGRLYFYDGKLDQLESGCYWMKGELIAGVAGRDAALSQDPSDDEPTRQKPE